MAKFTSCVEEGEGRITGDNCGCRYVHDNPNYHRSNGPGLVLNFKAPFEDARGCECVTVETPHGPVYLRIATEYTKESKIGHYMDPTDPVVYPLFNHYHSTMNPHKEPGIGMMSIIVHDEYIVPAANGYQDKDYWANIKKQHQVGARLRIENIEKKLEGAILYKSPKFYNLNHPERNYPSIIFYIFDQEKLQ